MRSIANLSWIVAAALGASTIPALADEPKGDLARLQGGWTARVGPDKNVAVTLVIKGNAAEIRGARPGGEEFKLKGEFKLDDKASPKTIDWGKFVSESNQDIPSTLAIYKLEGDSWTICDGGPGKERPARFEEGDEGRPRLVTWARVKEKAADKPIQGDLARFQGTWTARAGTDEDVVITMTVKVNAYTASWERGDGTKVELRGEIRVNEKADPRTIDFFHNQQNDGEDLKDNLGIYAFDGDKIKVCVGGGGNERPTEFKKGDDEARHLLVFEKKKG
jgi:uncharacterized protein (TIGR03067 family)